MTGQDIDSILPGIDMLIFGIIIGALAAFFIPRIFHFSPIYVDCGCGAQAEMVRQCFESYATNASSHWQCGVFK